jgi:hypothetical protein
MTTKNGLEIETNLYTSMIVLKQSTRPSAFSRLQVLDTENYSKTSKEVDIEFDVEAFE